MDLSTSLGGGSLSLRERVKGKEKSFDPKRDDAPASEPGGITPPPLPRIRAFVRGSTFQVRVWTALLRIPPGSLVTYGRLAAAIGHPSAARAVGSAVGQNPVAYLIPCHRVIRETGVMGGYRWDPVRKRAIVAWESQ